MKHKLCYACRHFRFDPGSPRWSEYTPGEDMVIDCDKDMWGEFRTREDFAKAIETAETCKHFELADWAKK